MFFQTLESRRLMAFTPFTFNGTLFLVGTAADESATVAQTGDGTVSLHDELSGEVTSFDGVRQLVVLAGGGLNGCRLITRDIPAVLQCGSGMDTFAIHNGALLVGDNPDVDPLRCPDEGAPVAVLAGAGADQIHIFDYGQVGTVALLGDGDDLGNVMLGSQNAASPTRVYGDNGSDILHGPGGIEEIGGVRSIVPGIGNVRLYGGSGGDELWSFSSDTWLDGGSGNDTAYIDEDAGPVILANVEQVLAALDAE